MENLLYFDIGFLTLYCFFSILFIAYYFIYKRKEFLSYALYLLFLTFYYILFSAIGYEFNIIKDNSSFESKNFQEILAAIIIVIYTIFIIQFLDLKNKNKKLFQLVNFFLYFNIISIPLILFFNYFNIHHRGLFFAANCVVGLYILIIVYRIIKLKIPYSFFILLGTSILILGGIVSIVLSIYEYNSTFWPTQVAILIDILLFNFALQKKAKDVEQQILRAEISKQKVILKERERIIADLHDDVGSSISILRINSELLQNDKITPQLKIKIIDKIVENSNTLAQQMNTIVWSLNNKNDTLQSFTEYVKLYCFNLFDGTNIQFKYTENMLILENLSVTGIWRKNVFLVIKEIINNTLKHSKATKVNLTFNCHNNLIEIVIDDNGIGIGKTNPFGNGLKNIEKRVAFINGEFEIIVENGTLINICCKLF